MKKNVLIGVVIGVIVLAVIGYFMMSGDDVEVGSENLGAGTGDAGGEGIVALDTENEIIIFSKNKIHEPIKLHLSSSYSPQFEGDEKVIYQLIGWNN